jgi:hypothetical protein
MFSHCLKILTASFFLWVTAVYANAAELETSELILGMKQSIIEAQKTATPPYMVIPWVEGEISYIIKKEGEVGFKLCVITAEGKYATEAVQRMKFRIEPQRGETWRVDAPGIFRGAVVSGVDYAAKKIFVVPEGERQGGATWPVKVTSDTTISDTSGKKQTLSEVYEGLKGTIQYTPGPTGDLKATTIIIKK